MRKYLYIIVTLLMMSSCHKESVTSYGSYGSCSVTFSVSEQTKSTIAKSEEEKTIRHIVYLLYRNDAFYLYQKFDVTGANIPSASFKGLLPDNYRIVVITGNNNIIPTTGGSYSSLVNNNLALAKYSIGSYGMMMFGYLDVTLEANKSVTKYVNLKHCCGRTVLNKINADINNRVFSPKNYKSFVIDEVFIHHAFDACRLDGSPLMASDVTSTSRIFNYWSKDHEVFTTNAGELDNTYIDTDILIDLSDGRAAYQHYTFNAKKDSGPYEQLTYASAVANENTTISLHVDTPDECTIGWVSTSRPPSDENLLASYFDGLPQSNKLSGHGKLSFNITKGQTVYFGMYRYESVYILFDDGELPLPGNVTVMAYTPNVLSKKQTVTSSKSQISFTESDNGYPTLYPMPTKGSTYPDSPSMIVKAVITYLDETTEDWYYKLALKDNSTGIISNTNHYLELTMESIGAPNPDADNPISVIFD